MISDKPKRPADRPQPKPQPKPPPRDPVKPEKRGQTPDRETRTGDRR
jgi:hypothetical protein